MTAQQIRDIVKAKAWIVQEEPETHERDLVISFLCKLRNDYIRRVELAHYLSQMLTHRYATRSASEFQLHWADGRQEKPEEDTQIQVYLRRFGRDLPYKVTTRTVGGIIERYM